LPTDSRINPGLCFGITFIVGSQYILVPFNHTPQDKMYADTGA
jgi:hypothetical protein